MKYRPEIDGLRAIAVVPVILFHAGVSLFSGGYAGVDVFFTISGFLITKIIIAEIQEKKFSIINFYERRARRIMPMVFLLLLTTSIASWFLLFPSAMKSFSGSVMAVIAFISNIFFAKGTDYWDMASELKPLLHTWSLGVEEQFYLFFPILVILIIKIRKQLLLPIMITGCLVSLVMAQYASENHPVANFYYLPTRAWELGIGSIVATLSINHKNWYEKAISNKSFNEIINAFGFVLILISIVFYSDETPFPSVYALLPTVGTALIIMFGSTTTVVGKFLSWKPMVTIGLISYSAYLWHHSIFAFVRYVSYPEPSFLTMILLSILVFPLSYLTWKYVEAPFRNKVKFTRKKIFAIWIVGSLIFLSFGFLGSKTNGFENRDFVQNLKVRSYTEDNNKLTQENYSILKKVNNVNKFEKTDDPTDLKLWFDLKDTRKKVLVIGNSHSIDLYNELYFSKDFQQNFQLARFGTQLRDISNKDHKLYQSLNFQNADIIFIATRFGKNGVANLDETLKNLLSHNKKVYITKNIFEYDVYGTRTLADVIIQKNIKENKPSFKDDQFVLNLTKDINYQHYLQYKEGKEDLNVTNKKVEEIVKKHPSITLMDRMDYQCDDPKKQCYMIDKNLNKYLFDYGHHTIEGAKFFGKRIDSINWIAPLLESN